MLERGSKFRREPPVGHQNHADHVELPLMEPAAIVELAVLDASGEEGPGGGAG